jgi:Rps23 Pro-64 3,4-dihydroxylase Tpa1-like proline 4-hydroxylase
LSRCFLSHLDGLSLNARLNSTLKQTTMNENLQIAIHKEPFPHLVITDLLTNSEVEKVRKEIEYLGFQNFSKDSFTSAKITGFTDGSVKSKAKYQVIYLDTIFRDAGCSVIGGLAYDMLGQGMFSLLKQVEPWADRMLQNSVQISPKINIYNHGDKYGAHQDSSFFTALLYLHERPKPYLGGELCFKDFNYDFACDHNSLILFPGHVNHEVKEVVAIDPANTKNLRTAINIFFNPLTEQPTP